MAPWSCVRVPFVHVGLICVTAGDVAVGLCTVYYYYCSSVLSSRLALHVLTSTTSMGCDFRVRPSHWAEQQWAMGGNRRVNEREKKNTKKRLWCIIEVLDGEMEMSWSDEELDTMGGCERRRLNRINKTSGAEVDRWWGVWEKTAYSGLSVATCWFSPSRASQIFSYSHLHIQSLTQVFSCSLFVFCFFFCLILFITCHMLLIYCLILSVAQDYLTLSVYFSEWWLVLFFSYWLIYTFFSRCCLSEVWV